MQFLNPFKTPLTSGSLLAVGAALLLSLVLSGCSSIPITDEIWQGSLPLKTLPTDQALLAQPMAAQFHTQVKGGDTAKILTFGQFLSLWNNPQAAMICTTAKVFLKNEANLRKVCSMPGGCSIDQTEAVDAFFSNVQMIQNHAIKSP